MAKTTDDLSGTEVQGRDRALDRLLKIAERIVAREIETMHVEPSAKNRSEGSSSRPAAERYAS